MTVENLRRGDVGSGWSLRTVSPCQPLSTSQVDRFVMIEMVEEDGYQKGMITRGLLVGDAGNGRLSVNNTPLPALSVCHSCGCESLFAYSCLESMTASAFAFGNADAGLSSWRFASSPASPRRIRLMAGIVLREVIDIKEERWTVLVDEEQMLKKNS